MAGATPIEIRPQPGPQEQFLASLADIVIYGGGAGGGKTFGLLLESIRFIDNPDFGAVVFRRTSPQITNEGGLWDECAKLFPLLGGKSNETKLEYTFPKGSRVRFAHMQHLKNMYDWQGAQIPLIGFDELTHFEREQFFYMLSRNRSMSGIKPYIRATCNPDADSWVAGLIEWWIDQETGLAIPERLGVLRWFVVMSDEVIWRDTKQELLDIYPNANPLSLTFIEASVYDNKKLLEKDPSYISKLEALPLVERERLLGRNWKIRAVAGNKFRAHWFKTVRVPKEEQRKAIILNLNLTKKVRCWDLGGSDSATSDFSVGKLAGSCVIEGKPAFVGVDVRRGQWTMYEREEQIRRACIADRELFGHNVETWLEAGIGNSFEPIEALARKLCSEGFNVRTDKVNKSKEDRADSASAFAESGGWYLVEAPWNDAFIDECCAFPDKRRKDDQVDTLSACHNKLSATEPIYLLID